MFRKQVSQLLAAGHTDAHHYPLGMVADEAQLLTNQENRRQVTATIMMQAVVLSAFSKEGGEHLRGLLKQLTPED